MISGRSYGLLQLGHFLSRLVRRASAHSLQKIWLQVLSMEFLGFSWQIEQSAICYHACQYKIGRDSH
jgi:hypothetical protein